LHAALAYAAEQVALFLRTELPAARFRDKPRARYVQALGGRLDLIASFGDHTLTVTTTEAA
jgi:hypothetical protein